MNSRMMKNEEVQHGPNRMQLNKKLKERKKTNVSANVKHPTSSTNVSTHTNLGSISTNVRPNYPTCVSLGYTSSVPCFSNVRSYMPPVMGGYTYTYQNNWTPVCTPLHAQNAMCSVPAQTGYPYSNMLPSPMMSDAVMPMLSPILPVNRPLHRSFETVNYDQIVPENTSYNSNAEVNLSQEVNAVNINKKAFKDPETYLKLPKELFPTARMLNIDPNSLIDEFCKVDDIQEHTNWILDLEFGVPREPVTRPLAIYDVQFNSVHCKNTPGAIHPAFDRCSPDFKKLVSFHYDCAISNWYRGYTTMTGEKSVPNFQNWLQTPMQTFGMCWP